MRKFSGLIGFSVFFFLILFILSFQSDDEENTKWNNFVESIKSKLTVKQVVDGVRSGGSLTFDYLLLIVTAELSSILWLIKLIV